MDWIKVLSLIFSGLSLIGVGYLFQYLWRTGLEKKKAKSEQAQQEAKKVRQDETREVFTECITPLSHRMDVIENVLADMKESQDAQRTGIQASLRNDILSAYYDCARKGYRTKDDSENFWDMYNAYHQLGGNSFIDKDVTGWFRELPSKEEFSRKGE